MSRSTRPAPSPAPSPRTRVRRMPERAHYEADTVAAIVDAAMICTVAFELDGMVHAIPTLHWREGEHLYIHGAKASRKGAQTLGNYQEARIRQLHLTLDEYLSG